VELGQPYTFTSIPTKISSRTTIPTPTEMLAAEGLRHFERRSWTLVDSIGRKRCRFELAPVSPGLLHPSDDFRLVLEKVGYPGRSASPSYTSLWWSPPFSSAPPLSQSDPQSNGWEAGLSGAFGSLQSALASASSAD
jgi:hypothetical protein